MEVFITIIVIIGCLLLAPLVAFMSIAVIGGSIAGFFLFIIVGVSGAVELTSSAFFTCWIAGIVLAVLIGIMGIAGDTKHNAEK